MNGYSVVELLKDSLVLQPGATGLVCGRDAELERVIRERSIYVLTPQSDVMAIDFAVLLDGYNRSMVVHAAEYLREGGVIIIDPYGATAMDFNVSIELADALKDFVGTVSASNEYILLKRKKHEYEIKPE